MESKLIVATLVVLCVGWVYAETCTKEGAFPVEDSGCTEFIICKYDSKDGTYTEIKDECPDKELFDPDKQKCTKDYSCEDDSTTIDCTAAGYFANPDDISGLTYIQCVLFNGILQGTLETCPDGTVFVSSTSTCQ